jgi:hypothetical protein
LVIIFLNKIYNFLIINNVFREMAKFLIGMQVLTDMPRSAFKAGVSDSFFFRCTAKNMTIQFEERRTN